MNAFAERTYRVWVPVVFVTSILLMGASAVSFGQRNYAQGILFAVLGFGSFMPMLWWLTGAAAREIAETKAKVTSLLIAYGVSPDRAGELLTKLQTEMRGITR